MTIIDPSTGTAGPAGPRERTGTDGHPTLTDLAGSLLGPLHLPGDPRYLAAVTGFNVATRHRPDAVVVAADAADVAATVRHAARTGRGVAVLATGHGAPATGAGTLLVDTRALDGVRVDVGARTATVGAGTRWQQVLDAAGAHGLGALCGSAPGVGVVGYTLGGGLGPVARTFGFSADHVRSVDLVGADGRLRTVDADHDADLFWALRGGGGAFGVVTSMTVDLLPVATVNAGGAWFSADVARTVLQHWTAWTRGLPDSVTTSACRLNLPPDPALPEPLRGRAVVHVRCTHVGDADEGRGLLEPVLRAATPLLAWQEEIPFAAIGRVHADPVHPLPVAERGTLLRDLPTAAVDAFVDVTSPAAGLPLMAAEIRLLGGAVGRAPAVPNAVGGRRAGFSVHAIAVPVPPVAEQVPAALAAVLDAVAPWSDGACLANFAGPPSPTADAALAAGHDPQDYRRLVGLRAAWDPEGVFAAAARWSPAPGATAAPATGRDLP